MVLKVNASLFGTLPCWHFIGVVVLFHQFRNPTWITQIRQIAHHAPQNSLTLVFSF